MSTSLTPFVRRQLITSPKRGSVKMARRDKDERGMTTAEYAVGTVATVTFAGVLLKIFSDPEMQSLLWKLILWIIKLITGFEF